MHNHNKILTFIARKNLLPDNATIIIGLSGGPDSVFLLHILVALQKEKNLTLIAAHLDHGWRPESGYDAQFCAEIAAHYQVTFLAQTISELNVTIKFNGSKEEVGRKARRYFFESVAKKYSAHAIALGHHADDQMETFFMRMLRGASLSGLVGMKSKDGLYIRPLLETKKEEILAYLHEHKIPFVTDISNQSDVYLRNRIRNLVIPALRECDTRFDQNFATTHAQLQETEAFLHELAQKTLDEISTDTVISLAALQTLDPILRNRVLMLWLIANKVPFSPSQGLFEEIMRFLDQPGDKTHMFYGQWSLHKKQGKVNLSFS